MTPRRLLGMSSLILTSLFVTLLAVQGRQLPMSQLQGMVFAAVMSLSLTLLVFQARTFAGAARWYIAALGIAVVGSLAAAVVTAKLGDVVGLLGSFAAALVCAAQCVAKLRAPTVDDAVISPRAVEALELLTERIKREGAETLTELRDATGKSEPFLLQRLKQLRTEAAHAEAWSRRMRLPVSHPARRTAVALQRRLCA